MGLQSNIDLMWLEDVLGSREAGIDSEWEACFLLNYPPSGNGELLVCPTVVLENGGTIALWYLPNALSCPIEDTILRLLPPLQDQLASSIFNVENNRLVGCLEFAPASQMQGHTWVRDMTILNSIISGALSIMHPQLYDIAAANHPHMHGAFSIWPTIFTNISAITNRCSSLHYYKDCILHIPSLGIDLMYSPGTVVTFSGHLLQHGVNPVEGNRYCLIYYMRDNIHNFVGVARCDWMRMDHVD
ncbi:hypothetical protein V8B97DRAFT_2021614 [Scleroderma yunnanense]